VGYSVSKKFNGAQALATSITMKGQMKVTKSKPPSLPRLHEMKIDDLVTKTAKAVHSSRQRIEDSKSTNEATRKLIAEGRQRRKKK
jgi:hypothetical protein